MLDIQYNGSKEWKDKITGLERLVYSIPDTDNIDNDMVHSVAANDHRAELSFAKIAMAVNALQHLKNIGYDNSWSKRGLFSCFFNMERKWERLTTLMFKHHNDTPTETFLDTCFDLAAYALKFCAWIAARRPDLYAKVLQYIVDEARATGVLPPEAPRPPRIPRYDVEKLPEAEEL